MYQIKVNKSSHFYGDVLDGKDTDYEIWIDHETCLTNKINALGLSTTIYVSQCIHSFKGESSRLLLILFPFSTYISLLILATFIFGQH